MLLNAYVMLLTTFVNRITRFQARAATMPDSTKAPITNAHIICTTCPAKVMIQLSILALVKYLKSHRS